MLPRKYTSTLVGISKRWRPVDRFLGADWQMGVVSFYTRVSLSYFQVGVHIADVPRFVGACTD